MITLAFNLQAERWGVQEIAWALSSAVLLAAAIWAIVSLVRLWMLGSEWAREMDADDSVPPGPDACPQDANWKRPVGPQGNP